MLGGVTDAPQKFSWKQGLVHALIPLAYVLVVGGLLSAIGRFADPFRVGQALGRASALLMLVALALSYLAQTGRRRLAIGLALGATVLIVGATLVGVAVLLGRAGANGP